MDESVRRAARGDATIVADLERAARAALVDQRGGIRLLEEQPAVENWSEILDDSRDDNGTVVFVGEIDGVVVGFLELRIASELAEVRQAYVDPEARELGLGDWLLEAATAVAVQRGCDVLEGTALPGDRATKNLYERAGIVARKIIVSRQL